MKSCVPRFKPYTPRSDERQPESPSLKSPTYGANYQSSSTIPTKSPRKGVPVPIMVHSTPKSNVASESPNENQPDTVRSSVGGESVKRSQEDGLVSQRSQESARTSSAFRLPLDALNTEESISDIEEIM